MFYFFHIAKLNAISFKLSPAILCVQSSKSVMTILHLVNIIKYLYLNQMCIVSEMVACVGAKVRGLEFESHIHIFSLTWYVLPVISIGIK